MPAERRWHKFTRENINKIDKDQIGAYLLGNKDKTPIRPGSGNLRNRLIAHLINNLLPQTKYFYFVLTSSKSEAEQIERKLFTDHLRKHPRMTRNVKRIPRERKSSMIF
jgi:hypothetical protein